MRKREIVPNAAKLNEEELELLLKLSRSEAAIVYMHGEQCIVAKEGERTFVFYHGGNVYRVIGTACTCPDSRFRHRKCKHVDALEALKW